VTGTGQQKARSSDTASFRLTDSISLGVLAETFHRDLLDEVLSETGRHEERLRRLPAHVMMRYCMAMCLFSDDSYEEVMRKLVGNLKDLRSWEDNWDIPSASALTQARQRLGYEPVQLLFDKVAAPVAGRGTKGAWLGSRRLMAIDGFSFDVPDTPANAEEFGRSKSGNRDSAFPKVLGVGLGECGTHAIVGAEFGPYNTAEVKLASRLLKYLEPGMLVMADRGFYGFQLWRDAAATGADLLWRCSSAVELPVIEPLDDGSYRSLLLHPRSERPRRDKLIAQARAGATLSEDSVIPVRVIEYEITDRRGGTAELICLITTILDHRDCPAVELAAAYHERWEFETTLDELKTHQRGSGRILRSQSPKMVLQEVWAFLLVHYAIRKLMCRAADEADVDVDRISFIRTLRLVRRHVTGQADFSPSHEKA
jgi:hypothetical protein